MSNKNTLSKLDGGDDDLISRPALAARWDCHMETLKRRERQGLLHPVRFSLRMVRYPLREVRALEREAGNIHPKIDAAQDLRQSTEVRPVKRRRRRKLSTAQAMPEIEPKGVVVEFEP